VKPCEVPRTYHKAVKVSLWMVHNFTPLQDLWRVQNSHAPVRKRVRVEFQDESGTKYTLGIEGRISREKVLKIMDLMELVEGEQNLEGPKADESTTFGKLLRVIDDSYAGKEFSSADLCRELEEELGARVSLSTVSTYLSRLAERGVLKRQRFGNSWVYRKTYLSPQLPSK